MSVKITGVRLYKKKTSKIIQIERSHQMNTRDFGMWQDKTNLLELHPVKPSGLVLMHIGKHIPLGFFKSLGSYVRQVRRELPGVEVKVELDKKK